jgi:hypothetical protein
VADESLADTLHDLANYCALFSGYLESERLSARDKALDELVRASEELDLYDVATAQSIDRVLADHCKTDYQGYIPEIEREYEIVAVSELNRNEFVIERCPDLTLAQHRLERQREEWPTFRLTIREVESEYQEIA